MKTLLTWTVLLLAVAIQVPLHAQIEDDCSGATNVSGATITFDFDSSLATTDGPDLSPCDPGPGPDDQIYNDQWIIWTPDFTGVAQLVLTSGGANTRVAAYTSTSCPADPATVINCFDVDPASPIALVFVATAGQGTLIRIGSTDPALDAAGTIEGSELGGIIITPTLAADDCAAASTETGTEIIFDFDTSAATTDGVELAPFCDPSAATDDQIYNDQWIRWTPAFTGIAQIASFSGGGRIAVYESATCPVDPASVLACGDLASGVSTALQIDVTAGVTITFRVGSDVPGGAFAGSILAGQGQPEVANFTCTSTSAGTVDLAWDLPAGTIDGLQVEVNGFPEASLPATDTSYTYSTPAGGSGAFEFRVRTVVSGSASLGTTCQFGVPTFGNDDCSNPIDLTTSGGGQVDTTLATTDGPDLAPNCDPGAGPDDQIYNDQWFRYTAPVDGSYQIILDTFGTGIDGRAAVYRTAMCPVDPASVAVCGDAGPSFGPLVFDATLGEVVTIRVGAGDPTAVVQGAVFIQSGVAPIPTVDCVLSPASDEIETTWTLPGSPAYDSIEVWVGGTLEATLGGSETSYTYSVPPGLVSIVEVCVRGVVGSQSSVDNCCFVAVGTPSNDECANAIDVGDGSFDFDTTAAQGFLEVPNCGDPIFGGSALVIQDVWYRITPGQSGPVTLSTCTNTLFDTVIAVYEDTGVCPPSTAALVDCNNNECDVQSQLTVDLEAGVTYLIQVGGSLITFGDPNSGPGTLEVNGSGPAQDQFIRGDANNDGTVDVSDSVFTLAALFVPGSPSPVCDDAADVNDDGGVDVSDSVFLLASLFVPGSDPIPAPITCGADPTSDSLECADPSACP